jgi:hypothetical protein
MKTPALPFLCLISLLLPALPCLRGADQHDTPALSSSASAARDIGDLYVFRSPANANNTVLVMTASQFVGVKTKPVFRSRPLRYEFRIDTDADGSTDLIFAVSFGPADRTGSQDVTLTKTRGFDAVATIASGRTNTNLPIVGGGLFRAGIFDDPFFFDQAAFDTKFVAGLPGFPRPVGTATNYYGPNANALGIVMEVPSSTINSLGGLIGVWARTAVRALPSDRCGRPLVNPMLIPPVPRNDRQFGDLRAKFNRGLPVNDREDFTDAMVNVLSNPAGVFHRTPADAASLANFFLPDQLVFQVGNPNGYGSIVGGSQLGNGRRLSDDVADITLNLLTNGAIPTDNVRDDNALKITDGSIDPVSGMTRAIAFPYLGLANNTPGGPNP